MQDVIELYWDLRKTAENNGDEIAQEFNVGHHEEPASFFGMAFNNITMTLELLDYYNRLWGSLTSTACSSAELTRAQNGERVIMLQKMSFIEVMSSFEYSAKKIVLSNPSTFGGFSGRIYLSLIMKRSFEKGLIGQATLDRWNGLIKLRNSLVHNNGISEETAMYEYPEVTVHVNENQMTQGNLMQFGILNKWLLNESKLWVSDANKAFKSDS